MTTYTTVQVKNLTTGQPFTFEVSDKWLERFELQKKLIATGKAPMLGTLENITKINEFSLFPAYQELLKIFFENGFTTELITQILSDFGVTEQFIEKLLEDESYISYIKGWFEGITCDGERAARTLSIVYSRTQNCYSLCPIPQSIF